MTTDPQTDVVRTDVLVVGAGPGGSSAAIHLARLGRDVLLVDGAEFPRDKACGDGLTPRAVAELQTLKLDHILEGGPVNKGLRGHGFGRSLMLPWNGPHLPKHGSAIARTVLDNALRDAALDAGATGLDGHKAVDVELTGGRLTTVLLRGRDGTVRVEAEHVIVADGGKSHLGRLLGRAWHKETVFGVASRAYATSPMADDPWITSHLELRDESGRMMGGYGWVFPLGNGLVNVGAGTLATSKRPANINLRKLTEEYARQRRDEWQLGELTGYGSAPLPMGGAVSNVAGRNWMLIGDAAACINPLNGEGIDYALETGRLAAEHIVESGARPDFTASWPAELYAEYGEAFSIARRLGILITHERLLAMSGPIGMRIPAIMAVAFRVMGNLVTPEDSDVVARAWRTAGRASLRLDRRRPFH
ncbi:geranylgeranyl reductase family protein [Longivirga aurantiaca]|uniref:Geranylgeranyl reductase family protein n=1 Tax=Longivirga aurantiaca TaxID=1837743 RepID=A0ABW1SX51_9ACTN